MKLDEIPYLSHVPRDGRDLLLLPWYDANDESWHLYLEAQPGDFIKMQNGAVSSGLYYAEHPASSSDLEILLATLVAQHLSFPPVARALYSLVDDLHLLSASLEKLELVRHVANGRAKSSFLVESELEYMFTLVRAMYDLLQKMAKEVASLLRTHDGKAVVAQLPGSFARAALDDDRPRTVEELQAKYSLPDPLASFYSAHSPRFIKFRAIRVDIEHHGRRIPMVFETEHGFGISTEGPPHWSSLEVWGQHTLLPNDIGSVRALAVYLAQSFLETLNDFEAALRRVIAPELLPPAVAHENRVFMTNPLIHNLSHLATAAASPWIDPPDASASEGMG